MELVTSGTDTKLLNDAIQSLATDSGIHPLVPYFIQFIQDEVGVIRELFLVGACALRFSSPSVSACSLAPEDGRVA
jgi:hypothetical protein